MQLMQRPWSATGSFPTPHPPSLTSRARGVQASDDADLELSGPQQGIAYLSGDRVTLTRRGFEAADGH